MKNNILSKKYLINYFYYANNFNDLVRYKTLNLSSIGIFFISLFFFLSGCKNKDNIVSPKKETADTTWIQGEGLQGYAVSGLGVSGNNLLAGASHFPLPYVYIFLSTDDGLTWKQEASFHVDNTIPHTDLIFTPSISFIDDGTVLLAGAWSLPRGAIYRSTDHGITWSDSGINWPEKDSDLTENMNCFCLANGKIFAGTSHGVYVSSDHGSNWAGFNTGLYDLNTNRGYSITGITNINSNIFVCTVGNGIYRSENDGNSWDKVNFTDYDFQSFATIGSNIFVSAFNQLGKQYTGGVFVSTDNGDSWQHTDSTLIDHGVGPLCSYGSFLFAETDTALFFTNNTGITWKNISIGREIFWTSSIMIHNLHMYTNSGGSIWRYPISLITGY